MELFKNARPVTGTFPARDRQVARRDGWWTGAAVCVVAATRRDNSGRGTKRQNPPLPPTPVQPSRCLIYDMLGQAVNRETTTGTSFYLPPRGLCSDIDNVSVDGHTSIGNKQDRCKVNGGYICRNTSHLILPQNKTVFESK